MKKLFALLTALAVLMSLAACGGRVIGEGTAEAQEVTAEEAAAAENTVEAEEVTAEEEAAEEPAEAEPAEEEPAEEEKPEEQTGMANPWTECADAAEAEEVSGLTLAYDINDVAGCLPTSITAMTGMIDIEYGVFTIRQAEATGEDISGNYNEDYIVVDDYDDCGVIFSCSWYDGYIVLTEFAFGDYSYVIYTEDGIDYNDLLPILTGITGVDSSEFGSGADSEISG